MANVDITELIPSLEASLTIPGQTSPYADATDAEWTVKLTNAFWRAVLEGVIEGFTIDEDGVISPTSGDATISRALQQVVVIYAAINIIQAQLLVLKTNFRAKAGPVEYETQQAASVLTGLLNMLENEKSIILTRISDLGSDTSTFYYDAPWERRYQQDIETTYWMGY